LTLWDRLLIALTLLGAFAAFFALPVVAGGNASTIKVAVDGVETHRLPLDKADEIKIKTTDGYCLMRVEGRRVRIKAADCPKKLCVNQGWISGAGESIICLPHRVVVAIDSGTANDSQIDAVLE
jgi:hypothetical protein